MAAIAGASLLLAMTGCDMEIRDKYVSTYPLTMATIVASGTGITETSPVLHLTAEYGTFTVSCDDGSCTDQSIAGTAWWDSGNGDVATTITDGATKIYTVVATDDGTDFLVEIHDTDSTLYVSTTTQLTAWGAGTYTGNSTSDSYTLVGGNTYTVTVTRSGDTYTVKYVDEGSSD